MPRCSSIFAMVAACALWGALTGCQRSASTPALVADPGATATAVGSAPTGVPVANAAAAAAVAPAAAAPAATKGEDPAPPAAEADSALGSPLRTFDLPQRDEGQGAAVATAHSLATRAAAGALHRGGTAIDALVAASFVLSVVTPHSTGIGGGGFAIVATAKGAATAWDFREAAPAAGALTDYLDEAGKPVA